MSRLLLAALLSALPILAHAGEPDWRAYTKAVRDQRDAAMQSDADMKAQAVVSEQERRAEIARIGEDLDLVIRAPGPDNNAQPGP